MMAVKLLTIRSFIRQIALVLWLAGSAVWAAPILVDRPNSLGNASSYGFLQIKRELGSLDMGNGVSLDVDLFFTSDPRLKPGAFGPGWFMPLFDSTVFAYSEDKIIWDGPDRERRFFDIADDGNVPRGKVLYEHQGGDLQAVLDERRNEYLITSRENPGWAFEYRDGRLVRFRLGKGTIACRLDYNGRGFPRAILAGDGNEVLVSVEYAGTTTPELITIGDSEYPVELGEGEMLSPDGKTSYKDYRVSFLTRVGDEQFSYSLGEPVEHVIKPTRVKKEAVTKTTPVNRITYSDENGVSSWAEWEARSGFLTADSAARYDVKNNAFDPFLGYEVEHVTDTPGNVSIKRFAEGEKRPEQLSFNWNSGMRTYTDAAGNVMRKTYIMAPGSAYKNLRKIEKKNDEGGWDTLKSFAYSTDGNLLRETDWISDVQTHYIRDGDVLRVIRGDQLVREDTFSNGNIVESLQFDNGRLTREVFKRMDGLTRKLTITEGQIEKIHAYTEKWIIFRRKGGNWFFRERDTGFHYIALEDGRIRLKNLIDGKLRHVGWIEDPTEVEEIINIITKINDGL